eukprot:s4498_g2.t1
MAAVPAAAVDTKAAEKVCKLCNRQVPEAEGRQHGKAFRCLPCATIERSMHRNLGTTAELGTWSNAECHAFFRKLQEEKTEHGGLQWATIRAVLKRQMTERKISSFAATTEVTPLPLSVLLAQGWEKTVVERFEKEDSETYGVPVYKVPITKFSWKDMFESVEEKLLQQEKDATQRRSGKKNKDETLDVPENDKTSDKTSAKEKANERKEQQELRKRTTHNAKVAAHAAKAMGPLATAESSLTKLLAKVEGKEGIDETAKKFCQDKLQEVTAWNKDCRAAVNLQEKNKALPTEEVQPRLDDLPFEGSDLRATLKQIGEGQKALRASMPKQAAAPKKRAAASETATGEAGADAVKAEEPPKRRRAKTAA